MYDYWLYQGNYVVCVLASGKWLPFVMEQRDLIGDYHAFSYQIFCDNFMHLDMIYMPSFSPYQSYFFS